MNRPDLSGLAAWIGADLLASVAKERRDRGEVQRERSLGTAEMVWLMLAVALDTGRSGLHEILRLATARLDLPWEVSTAAFCKARGRFSPQASARPARAPGTAALSPAREQSRHVEGLHAQSHRQGHAQSSRLAGTVQEVRGAPRFARPRTRQRRNVLRVRGPAPPPPGMGHGQGQHQRAAAP